MRSSLDAFLEEIKELATFVDSVSSVYSILAKYGDTCIKASLNLRRRLDYSSFIIALYTGLERYVEDLAWSFAVQESSKNRYSELHKDLRDKHLRQSAELLNRGRLGEGRYTGLTNEGIVGNLYECLNDKVPYRLNRHAVIFHESNIRGEVVQGIFKSIGIENVNALACHTDALNNWFSSTTGLESSTDTSLLSMVEIRLKDLVDRRNQIVHAGTSTSEAFDPNVMTENLKFFEDYGRALFNVVGGVYLHRYYVKSSDLKGFGLPKEGPIKDDFVVVVENPHCRIFRGQSVFGVRENRVIRWGKIIEIRVDNKIVENIEADSTFPDVGLQVDFKLSKNIQLFGIEKKDEAIWE
jgi:hypothetical protein